MFLNRIYNLLKQTKMTEIKEAKQYQWKKGDDFGKVVEFKDFEDSFTVFTDGSRIFTNVLNEFLEEIIDGVIPYPGAEAVGINSPSKQSTKPSPQPIVNVVSEVSPMQSLVEKLSKKNHEEVDVKFNINIPKKQIVSMLIENSADEDNDIINTVIDSAINQIEINKLQEFLKKEITNFINKYYE